MRSLDNNAITRRLTSDGLLLGVALVLSYLEYLLPLNLLIPLPGMKLGLGQLAVTVSFFFAGKKDAALVSCIRVLIMGLLFGSATSLYFSACGAFLSFCGLFIGALFKKRLSYIGLGILCAGLHNAGQCFAAATLFGTGVLLTYLPVLLIASAVFGGLGGWIMNIIAGRLEIITSEKRHG